MSRLKLGGKPFLTNRLCMQALLQMQDIPSAISALQFYTNVQPSIRHINFCNLAMLIFHFIFIKYFAGTTSPWLGVHIFTPLYEDVSSSPGLCVPCYGHEEKNIRDNRAKSQHLPFLCFSLNLYSWFENFPFFTRGRNVYVQFSSHQELTTMDQNSQGRGDEVSALKSDIERKVWLVLGVFQKQLLVDLSSCHKYFWHGLIET